MAALAVFLLSLYPMHAQTSPAADDASTLHVYVNLVQIPVLVLNSSLHPMQTIPSSQFNVSIEGIGRIRPARIRLEGDDPINLTLIVDRSVRDDDIWDDLPKSLAPLTQALRPQDHLSVYAFDGCGARRMGGEMAPFEASWLRLAVASATEVKPFKEDRRKKAVCEKPLTYWDMVYYTASRLAQVPGRKLIVTLGPGAQVTAQRASQIHDVLISNSISLFPIVHGDGSGSSNPYGSANMVRAGRYMMNIAPVTMDATTEAPLALIMQSELSGGMVVGTTFRSLAKALAQPVTLARGRYIIEFPRPDALPPGNHQILVADGHVRDFIRPGGISVPLADPKERRELVVNSGDAGVDTTASSTPSPEPKSDTKQTPTATTPPQPPPVAAPVAAAPSITTKPAPDPTDITGDLRPNH